jgi:hypothetical protein
LGGIAVDITHRRVQLRQCQTKAIGHARTPGFAFYARFSRSLPK